MSADAHQPTSPNARKRTRSTMQAADPTAQSAAQPADGAPPASAEDGFVVDGDAIGSGDDDDEEGGGKSHDKKAGRRKIKIEFIQDKSRRHITFSKRKAGIMKKAYELSTLTGTQVLLLVVSETGLVYTFTTAKLQPLVTQPEGKNLIQACLNAPHGAPPSSMPLGAPLQRSAPQQIAPPPPQQGAPAPSGALPPGTRNVPGGLAISGAAGGQDGEQDGDDGHEEADAEGEKRGAARRRTGSTSAANAKTAGAPGSQRSPTSPPMQGGAPGIYGAPPDGAPPGAPMPGYTMHPGMMAAPYGYQQAGAWPQSAAYPRR